MQAQIRTPTVGRLFEQSAPTTTLKPTVRMPDSGLAYRRPEKEFFLPPVGTRVRHPPELQRGRAVGPRFLKNSFLELEAVLL